MVVEALAEQYESIKTANGFDEAIIGISRDFMEPRVVYSVSKVIEILERDMEPLDAREYFEFNMAGAYVGEDTPIWCHDELVIEIRESQVTQAEKVPVQSAQ